MYRISDQQVDFILADIKKHGIRIESLQQNLLDHICIIIEQNLEQHDDFEKFYREIIKTFYKEELKEIEEEAIFLVKSKGPFLLLSRLQFFLLLFITFIGPYITYDLVWFFNEGHGSVLPVEVWSGTMVFATFPLLVLLVLYFTPEKLDPLIPRKSKILLGIRPFIKIIPPTEKYASYQQ
ncbi:MAG: hypothetical protein JST75_17080 [Bacteroidetes bacterium]|nr:hypothetical protein [Bacteroidota bacterium]